MWEWLLEIYTEPLFWLFPVAGTVIGVVSFLAFAVPFTLLAWKQPAWAEPYRIQARKTGRRSIVGPAFWHVARNNAVMAIATVATLYIWIVLRQWEAAEGHAGYDFPWSPTHLFPFSDGATHHDFHHAKVKGNYAGFFPWNDAVFGTLCAGYAEHLARRKG
jgi:hypothetical protein